jgi:hypothetical protein
MLKMKIMRKSSIYVMLVLMVAMGAMISCENQDWEFPDYPYTTTYFPYQYPVRTLVLGDYLMDNENDNNHKFIISGLIGGLYENTKGYTFDYSLAPDLVTGLANPTGGPLQVLPASYYTMTPAGSVNVPKGSFAGEIEVQLNDNFFSDPLSIATNYVIPLQITSATTDSILSGLPDVADPDPRVASHWKISPMNFTLFGVRFISPYHARYLHRGRVAITETATGNPLETISYRKPYIVDDEVWFLTTTGLNTVKVSAPVRLTAGSPGSFSMELSFDASGNCTISETTPSPFTVTGSGTYVSEGDEWGGMKRGTIYCTYTIQDGTNTYTATDTLVMRDRAVALETFNPVFL